MVTIKDLEEQSISVNADLTAIKMELGAPKNNLSINKKSFTLAKEKLSEVQKKQKNYIKYYEDNQKRFRVLKKYGEVLQLVEKLLNLIPGELKNLSTEELENRLEELLNRKRKNEMQIHFIFYQNLITDLLSNLITIEKNYHEGKISSAEALADVKESKQQIKEHSKDFPPVLKDTVQEASYLVKIYEKSFSNETTKTNPSNPTPLKETKLEVKHELLFKKLNEDSSCLISRVENLSQNLSNFEPHVDLDKLTGKLKNTEDVLAVDNWSVDRLDSAVEDLKSTTVSLTDKQIDLNKTNSNLEQEIKDCSTYAEQLTKESNKEFSTHTFEDITKRAEEDKQVSNEIIELLEEDATLSTTIGLQVANTIIAQVEADKNVVEDIVPEEGVDSTPECCSDIEETLDASDELKDKVLTLEEKRELLLKLEQTKAENEDKKE